MTQSAIVAIIIQDISWCWCSSRISTVASHRYMCHAMWYTKGIYVAKNFFRYACTLSLTNPAIISSIQYEKWTIHNFSNRDISGNSCRTTKTNKISITRKSHKWEIKDKSFLFIWCKYMNVKDFIYWIFSDIGSIIFCGLYSTWSVSC
jgi:hypothetical protein